MMDNLRGSLLMVLAMLGFAIEDMLIKQMADGLPVGQVIVIISVGGAVFFAAALKLRGDRLFSWALLQPAIIWRSLFEMIGTLGFVSAIALTPISTASAILQATPLVVTLGATLFLGETVGWRRWAAIIVGLCGVLLIIRPGLEGFDVKSLLAVVGVVGLAGRDLCTRRLPVGMPTRLIAFFAFLSTIVTGFVLLWLGVTGDAWVATTGHDNLRLAAAVVVGILAYYAIVGATRLGDVAIVSPFRYTRLVFALVVGVVAFQERPDTATLIGAAIIVASGVYTLWREARLRRTSPL